MRTHLTLCSVSALHMGKQWQKKTFSGKKKLFKR